MGSASAWGRRLTLAGSGEGWRATQCSSPMTDSTLLALHGVIEESGERERNVSVRQ